jgi:hypothetical protein
VTKFVGKFRKNKNYNDDYNYDSKRHKDEHSEIKKLLIRNYDEDYFDETTSLPENNENRVEAQHK